MPEERHQNITAVLSVIGIAIFLAWWIPASWAWLVNFGSQWNLPVPVL